jgi:DNA-binding NarL/FixJ family response regulator
MVFVSVSAFVDEPLVSAGLEAGAAAYLLKTASRASICLNIAAAARAPGASAAPRPVSGLTH